MGKHEFSEMRKNLEAAHFEIIKRREYRGARESDVVAWLAEYVEQNFVPKEQLSRAEDALKFYADNGFDEAGGKHAREYFKAKEL